MGRNIFSELTWSLQLSDASSDVVRKLGSSETDLVFKGGGYVG